MSLLEKANAWAANDPDTKTKAELEELIAAGNLSEIESRFSQLLQFGTAGLRGELGAGPNRMNRVVVAYAAAAIAEFLKRNRVSFMDPNRVLSIVIGFDGRENSDVFAKDTARIIAAAGLQSMLFDQRVPTPVAAFTGRRLNASATIVVTASHNPPRDNGYKVYLGGEFGGSQLISPQDKEIAQLIEDNYQKLTFDSIPKSEEYLTLSSQDVELYRQRALELIPAANSARSGIKILHTALHGVGSAVVESIFNSSGFDLHLVEKQRFPDPAFPTVACPNPEEPGAMDLAFEEASALSADLILANDPDADRLAVAIPEGNQWKMLTGDEVGILLADHCSSRAKSGAIANSIVSADISKVAEAYGLKYQQTLTGFKWISKVPNLIYGYEEALGYCVDPSYTPDKDGITAALLVAEIAANLAAQKLTLKDKLNELSGKFGQISTGQVSIRVSDLTVISKVMRFVRKMPDKSFEGNLQKSDLLESSNLNADAVILSNEKARLIFRPSGTEPKLKCYLQYRGEQAGLAKLKEFASDLLRSAQQSA